MSDLKQAVDLDFPSLIIAILVAAVIFGGEPDLMDGFIYTLMDGNVEVCDLVEPLETQS